MQKRVKSVVIVIEWKRRRRLVSQTNGFISITSVRKVRSFQLFNFHKRTQPTALTKEEEEEEEDLPGNGLQVLQSEAAPNMEIEHNLLAFSHGNWKALWLITEGKNRSIG
ncbi:hypothetical protein KFK09_017288 [Dendrobium nobile]|uniref:Uncharacterized protein n=1 Tax=Dendrobium nobile TaxID=94219 RepID=A0A8T3B1X4_DENNO|nr:hypothetical protein KFK09_017288 [Dendrobium nobile]